MTYQKYSVDKMKKLVGTFFWRIDRKLLGHTCTKKPFTFRTDGIAFLEKGNNAKIHAHCIVRFNKGTTLAREMISNIYWTELCENGTIDIKPIYDTAGLADYCTKGMLKWSYEFNDQIILLRDYFPR